jgi:hypothetical protein
MKNLIMFVACLLLGASAAASARPARSRAAAQLPVVSLIPAGQEIEFPSPADSNSPSYWNDEGDLVLFTSVGHPSFSVGRDLATLTTVGEVAFETETPGRKWLESVVRTRDGVLYGYYHQEPAAICPETDLTEPRIGAAVSQDDGQTWRDLGIILTARPGYLHCDTPNSYFAGGVGDFTAILDRDERYLYFVFTTYAGDLGEQGVSVARLDWADRDKPVGRVSKFFDGHWLEPGIAGAATSIFPALPLWEEPETDAFWGPSLHWNTSVQQYVMLLNHDIGPNWTQEGIYVAFAPTLDDPSLWSSPEKIMDGGDWYPQVVGLKDRRGTDAIAGKEAWFCLRGTCSFRIVFEMQEATASTLRPGVVVSAPAKTVAIKAKHAPIRPRRRGSTSGE